MRQLFLQSFGWAILAQEAMTALADCRWLLITCAVFLTVDFYWGWRESAIRYELAVKANDSFGMKEYKFHFSRAGRRTLNKLIEYLSYFLIGIVLGLAIFEPFDIATHTHTAAVGILLGCLFDICSIVGHVLFVHGISTKGQSVGRVIMQILISFVKKKDRDVGEAIEETIEDTIEEKEGKK